MGWLTGEKAAACLACGGMTCRCRAIGRKDVKTAKKAKAPRVCNSRLRSGATCHRTVAHGEACGNSGH